MKINQRIIIVIVIVVFIAAFAFLYMNYSKETSQQKLLKQNLLNAKSTLDTVTNNKASQQTLLDQAKTEVATLQSQLAQAQQQLREKQQVIPEAIENIDYNELLFNIAQQDGLKVLSINTNGPAQNQVDKVTLYVTMFTISVEGQSANILQFVSDIAQDSNFISGTIDLVTMTVTTEEGPEGELITITQGDINLSLYGYEG